MKRILNFILAAILGTIFGILSILLIVIVLFMDLIWKIYGDNRIGKWCHNTSTSIAQMYEELYDINVLK